MENDNSGLWIGLGIAAVLAAGAGLYFGKSFLASRSAAPLPIAAKNDAGAFASLSLEQGDALVRERAKALSVRPQWQDWLKTEDLLRRFVAAAAIVADGKSPRASLEFLAPAKPFGTVARSGRVFLDPRGYARYDAFADSIRSVDPQAAGRLFQELRPLFQKAYGELGTPNRDVQEVLIQAINGLLKTPVVRGDVALRKKVVSYSMTDDSLERLSPAQKHLLRMGPDNTVKVQAFLREFALAVGGRDDQLAVPLAYSAR